MHRPFPNGSVSRLDVAGMSWSMDGAEAMIRLRAVFIDELWEEFWDFKTDREKKRLYAKYTSTTLNCPKQAEIREAA